MAIRVIDMDRVQPPVLCKLALRQPLPYPVHFLSRDEMSIRAQPVGSQRFFGISRDDCGPQSAFGGRVPHRRRTRLQCGSDIAAGSVSHAILIPGSPNRFTSTRRGDARWFPRRQQPPVALRRTVRFATSIAAGREPTASHQMFAALQFALSPIDGSGSYGGGRSPRAGRLPGRVGGALFAIVRDSREPQEVPMRSSSGELREVLRRGQPHLWTLLRLPKM
jgi:hypothetical protein